MCVRLRVAALGAVLLAAAAAAQAQSAIALADVLTRARERAPQIVSARWALDEARGRLLGASLRAQTNPELDVQTGNRQTSSGRWTDVELGVMQMLEPGSRRSARMAGANAAIAQGTADVEETTRTVLRAAALAYYRAVHAREPDDKAPLVGKPLGSDGRGRRVAEPVADADDDAEEDVEGGERAREAREHEAGADEDAAADNRMPAGDKG